MALARSLVRHLAPPENMRVRVLRLVLSAIQEATLSLVLSLARIAKLGRSAAQVQGFVNSVRSGSTQEQHLRLALVAVV